MKCNEGMADRLVRIVIGIVLLALVFTGPKSPWGWIGLLPLVTGVVGYCPLYIPFRFSTAPPRKAP